MHIAGGVEALQKKYDDLGPMTMPEKVLLGIFAVGAPGVPGGTVVASLGIVTGVLGFDPNGVALLIAIFALQDSFGTACNVTGDGALTLMLTGYAEKHGIADTGDLESPIL